MNIDKLTSEIASRLRAERARANLTLRQAGERSGVHYITIGRYENGALPTLGALYKLAETYGVDAVVFFPPSTEVVGESKRKGKK